MCSEDIKFTLSAILWAIICGLIIWYMGDWTPEVDARKIFRKDECYYAKGWSSTLKIYDVDEDTIYYTSAGAKGINHSKVETEKDASKYKKIECKAVGL